MDEVSGFLAGTAVCKGFDGQDIRKIAEVCKTVNFKDGEVIVEEDSRGRCLYIVRHGRTRITVGHSPGQHDCNTIAKCLPGQIFGELAFLDGARRSTWVVAVDAVEAIQISWEDFSGLVEREPKIAYQFMYNVAVLIADRLRDTTMFCSNLLGVR